MGRGTIEKITVYGLDGDFYQAGNCNEKWKRYSPMLPGLIIQVNMLRTSQMLTTHAHFGAGGNEIVIADFCCRSLWCEGLANDATIMYREVISFEHAVKKVITSFRAFQVKRLINHSLVM